MNDLTVLDTETMEWSRAPVVSKGPKGAPAGRAYHTLTAVEGSAAGECSLFLFGGNNEEQSFGGGNNPAATLPPSSAVVSALCA